MACEPSLVAQRCWADAVRIWGERVHYLGIVGDQAHSLRESDHNCGQFAGYDPTKAHALDIGVESDELGWEIVELLKKDPRVKYIIFKGQGIRPDHRVEAGEARFFESFDHDGHVHVSFMPGTTNDTRPFFGNITGPPNSGDDELDTTQNELLVGIAQVLGVNAESDTLLSGDRTIQSATQVQPLILIEGPDKVFLTNGLIRRQCAPGEGVLAEKLFGAQRKKIGKNRLGQFLKMTVDVNDLVADDPPG